MHKVEASTYDAGGRDIPGGLVVQPEQELVSPHHRAALRAPMRRRQYLVALLCCFVAAAHTDLVLGKKLKGMHAQQKHSLYCIIAAYGSGHHSTPPGQIETLISLQFCHASMACSRHACANMQDMQ